MRPLRVLAAGLLLLLAAIGGAIWYTASHENELVHLILAEIGQRTGVEIRISGSRLGLGGRLVVVLEEPRVIIEHQETARLEVIRAVISYWSLLHRTGLPLYALVLVRGTISVAHEVEQAPGLSLATSQMDKLTAYLDKLSDISRRFDLIDVSLLDQSSEPLAEHMNVVAFRQHYRHGTWPWIVKFDAQANRGAIAGARFSGDLQLGHESENPGMLAQGQVWFWKVPLRYVDLADFDASADLDGNIKMKVSTEAQAVGSFTLATRDLVLGGAAVRTPLVPGSLWSRGSYRISQSRLELSHLELRHQQSPILEGQMTVFDPFVSSRRVTFSASGQALALAYTANWLRPLRAVPPPMVHFAERIRSGTLIVNQVSLKSPQLFEKLNPENLAGLLDINASVMKFSYVPPPNLGIPPVYQFDAQMSYSGGIARIRQATGQIGGSSISDLTLDVNVLKAPDEITYSLKMATWLDAGDLYGATSDFIQRAQPRLCGQVQWVSGHTSIQVQANGTVKELQAEIPSDYLIKVELGDVEFQLNKLPSAIWLNSGSIRLEPGRISLTQVVARPFKESGNVVFNGVIQSDTKPVQFRDFGMEVHQLSSAKWVALMVNPGQLSVAGPMGGKIVANSEAGSEIPTVVGKLTLDNGSVQPGFLRSPIIVTRSATLVLNGKGLIFDIPGSLLEGEPLDFRMSVDDFNHPQLRIDANAARLDFLAMRFIRLPWSPSRPPQFFPVPVVGHIEAQAGNFDKLPMTNISTDFHHESQTWRVDRFRATAFNGTIDLTISGRARDDWINFNGVVSEMDAGPLFQLSGAGSEVPIAGKLSATGSLWANTSTDFFSTLAGNLSITMTDGTLNRFTLLKRMLSLINLKNWLTVQFPDPRKSGIPFNTLDADFRGSNGNFYTNNLRLNGPVMIIAARGNIDLANSTMNMEIDLLALQTVNWLLNNIPIIGKHLGDATQNLLGAYFQVRGPIESPAIRPKPLTSVAKFVLKTLSLPINVIAPNTIQ